MVRRLSVLLSDRSHVCNTVKITSGLEVLVLMPRTSYSAWVYSLSSSPCVFPRLGSREVLGQKHSIQTDRELGCVQAEWKPPLPPQLYRGLVLDTPLSTMCLLVYFWGEWSCYIIIKFSYKVVPSTYRLNCTNSVSSVLRMENPWTVISFLWI